MKEFLSGFAERFRSAKNLKRRLAVLISGVVLMGLAVAVLDRIGWGADMYSTFNLGISRRIGMSFGTWQMILNAVMLIFVLWRSPRLIGVGTLANMFLVGYSADLFSFLMDTLGLHPEALETAGKIAVFVPAIALFLVAAAFYMVVDLGTAPYDSMPLLIHDTFKKPSFMAVRMLWDVSFILLGLLVGGDVGIVTVAIAFGLGPVIRAVADRFRPMIIPGDEKG